MNPLLTKTYNQEAAINPYRICKFGAADYGVIQATASTENFVGVSGKVAGGASGDRIDLYTHGQVEVEYGGNVTRGDPLTSDSVGRAVTAAPGAGTNATIIGYAEVSGVSGDIGEVDISKGRIQG